MREKLTPAKAAKRARMDRRDAERKRQADTKRRVADQLARAEAARQRKADRQAQGASGPEIDWDATEELSPQARRALLHLRDEQRELGSAS